MWVCITLATAQRGGEWIEGGSPLAGSVAIIIVIITLLVSLWTVVQSGQTSGNPVEVGSLRQWC
jgi:hypothetical protein